MAVRGLKTKIAASVALLLFLSAFLTGIIVTLITQKIIVSGHLDRHQEVIESISSIFTSYSPEESFTKTSANYDFPTAFLDPAQISAALWINDSGIAILEFGDVERYAQLLRSTARNALNRSEAQRQFTGLKWAVIWWQADKAVITAPIRQKNLIKGAWAAIVPLTPIYSRLRPFILPIVLYMLFNTAVLTLIGLYRVFRLYLRPIDRMVEQAQTYSMDEDFLFSFRREDDELNRLSRALNNMLERIAGDRQKLQDSIASLGKANEDLRKAQHDIIRAEKMASVGRLAAGVAHEIGNPIGIVLGYLDLLKQEGLAPSEQKDYLTRSENEIQRINRVIRQLLDLARPQPTQPSELSIHDVINEFLNTMQSQPILAGITIDTRFKAEQDHVFCDSDQLRQVLLNIVINAADAIHEAGADSEGSIILSTSNASIQRNIQPPWVEIEIRDTGPGIAPEQLENIFDPFFTTKEPGKGTGLGLAVSYMIVEKMGGSIQAFSKPGEGTTMIINLPLMDHESDDKK